MQRDLRHFTDRQKAAADRSLKEQQQELPKPPKRRGGSSLLAALNGQLLRGGGDGGSAASSAASVAVAPPPIQPALPLHEHSRTAPAVQAKPAQCKEQEEQQQERRRQQRQPDGQHRQQSCQPPQPGVGLPAALQPCPLCGRYLPAGQELQAHVEAELLDLEAAEAEAEAEQWEADSRAAGDRDAWPLHRLQQQHQQEQNLAAGPPPQRGQQQIGLQQQRQAGQLAARQKRPRQPVAPVLVLGGQPAVTAPTDLHGLLRLHRQQLLPAKRRPTASAFNFFDDGSGVLGGEDIGLEGAPDVLKWEGMGTSDF